MSTPPNAAHAVRLRIELDNRPGSLGRIATAIGEAGGNITSLHVVEVAGGRMVRDVTVFASDEAHAHRIGQAVAALDWVEVREATDLTFELHQRGKIEVRSKSPLATRDDLSMAYTPGLAWPSPTTPPGPTS